MNYMPKTKLILWLVTSKNKNCNVVFLVVFGSVFLSSKVERRQARETSFLLITFATRCSKSIKWVAWLVNSCKNALPKWAFALQYLYHCLTISSVWRYYDFCSSLRLLLGWLWYLRVLGSNLILRSSQEHMFARCYLYFALNSEHCIKSVITLKLSFAKHHCHVAYLWFDQRIKASFPVPKRKTQMLDQLWLLKFYFCLFFL